MHICKCKSMCIYVFDIKEFLCIYFFYYLTLFYECLFCVVIWIYVYDEIECVYVFKSILYKSNLYKIHLTYKYKIFYKIIK